MITQMLIFQNYYSISFLNPNDAGLFEDSFLSEMGDQFDHPPSYFKKN